MPGPLLEVADVFRDHGAAWRAANAGHINLNQLKVMSAIERCRTAALGGHVTRCADCAHAPSGRRGRQQAYWDAAIQACLTLKVLFGLPLRQTTGFVASLLKLVGLDWSVPDYSTLCRRQRTLSVAIPYKGSAGPLHLLIDSTGIKAEGEGEWNARKHGGSKRRLWRKIHIGIDEETLEIRAIEVTSSSIGDAPMLPDMLSQIPPDQELGSVTADGAYDTRKCHDAIAARDAHAVIPPRKNAKMWKPDTPGARARNEAERSSKYLGRALEQPHLSGPY